MTLTAGDIQSVIHQLRAERYLLAADVLTDTMGPLLRKLTQPREETEPLDAYLRLLTIPSRSLLVIEKQVGRLLSAQGRRQLEKLRGAVSLFSSPRTNMILYTADDGDDGTMLCATVSDLTEQMRQVLWKPEHAFVLASGTLAVGDDFHRFRSQTGLMDGRRVTESVSLSPFDYKQNCLLYLPQLPPSQSSEAYYDELADEIAELIRAAWGHALVLFTSYAAMSAVKDRLREQELSFPLFTLGRNAMHMTERFRQTPGAVLLATGAAWEGFDFPGDCVSLLVIPRLPFAYPDALKEKEREEYASLRQFIQNVAVPEMQIKLRQGFGRAIRTESDTCVIAILDERAGRGHRYNKAMRDALPDMRTTSSLRAVTKFLRELKPESYFEVCA